MALTPFALHELAEEVLGCVCAALDAVAADEEDVLGCPERACVVPGKAAWDSCDDPCGGGTPGQLTVNVAQIFPSTSFPTLDREVRGMRSCPPPAVTAAELVITLLRCAPGPDENGCPPSCEELAASARQLHVDATTVYNALICCLPKTGSGRRGPKYVLGIQRTVGPEGLCVGIEQRVTVALPGCGRCPGEEVS
ncbi:hypothetical protein [Streptomyces variegatus]|uniref:hypothetical protein n=1 Tax=Streptomyces variegatus TaxID=284040 RepID=UPI003C2F00D5